MPTRTRPPASRGRFLGLAYWLLMAGFVVWNAWWFWRDRPAQDMRMIDGWLARGKVDDAERALRQVVRLSPRHGDARMKLARLLGQRDNYLACAEQLHQVPAWWPSKPEALFLEGQAYKLLNRARDAEAAWTACSTDDPLHPVPPRYFHGAAKELIGYYLLEGRTDAARQALWRAYEVGSSEERPGILVMRLRWELDRITHEESLAKLRRFAAVTPDDWQVRRALASEEQWAGDTAAADRHINACLKARPDDPAVHRTRLDILYQRGDREAIKTALTGLPGSADGDAEIWKYRGLASEWSGDLAAAAAAYLRATELNPFEAEYHYKLGVTEQRLGHPEQAREEIRKSQEYRKAFARMRDAYFEYLKVIGKAGPSDPPYKAAVERLASSCSELGWKREAEAWRRVASEG